MNKAHNNQTETSSFENPAVKTEIKDSTVSQGIRLTIIKRPKNRNLKLRKLQTFEIII